MAGVGMVESFAINILRVIISQVRIRHTIRGI
jgi:hypothetical protein